MLRQRIFAGLLVMALALSLFAAPATAAGADKTFAAPRSTSGEPVEVPKGYNVNDFTKLSAFLETTDGNGVKNGAKLSESYDPADPSTWGSAVQWTELDGEMRLLRIDADSSGLSGSLDLSGCAALEKLNLSNNSLTKLDVSGDGALLSLACNSNQLTELTLSGNGKLSSVECYRNRLTSLDFSDAVRLSTLFCYENQLTSLLIPQCTRLRNLYCGQNQLSALDVSACTNLYSLSCSVNELTALDVSQNPGLTMLVCGANPIAELDLSANTALTTLYCNDSRLTQLHLDHLTRLSTLLCYNNQITDLTLSTVTTILRCSDNPLGELNVSACGWLRDLECNNTNLKELDISQNTLLSNLECADNQLRELDTTVHTALNYLNCSGNQLTALNLKNAAGLLSLNCAGNPLQTIDLTQNAKLWNLDIRDTEITELDLSANVDLSALNTSPVFKSLDLSAATNFPADRVTAVGSGRIGVTSVNSDDLYPDTSYNHWQISIHAVPEEEGAFQGWYEDSDCTKLIGSDSAVCIQTVAENGTVESREEREYYAQFTGTSACTHGETELRDAKEASCTEDGYTGDTYCKLCGRLLEEGETIPALGHKTELKNAKEATCTEDGYTGDEICTVCGETVKMGEAIPALGHKTELKNAKEATCTEDGYTGDEICTVCGETVKQGEVIPAHCDSQAFSDLDINRWYHEYTDYVISHELMNGVSDNRFAPDSKLTRGMLVTTLYRLAGEPEVTEAATFTDVPGNRYFTQAIAWAQDVGLAKGVTEIRFAPESSVTREQAVTFLYRYVTLILEQEPGRGGDLTQFTDAGKISKFAEKPMAWATAEGFLEGYGDGTVGPQKSVTRAQMAKFLTILSQDF